MNVIDLIEARLDKYVKQETKSNKTEPRKTKAPKGWSSVGTDCPDANGITQRDESNGQRLIRKD